MKITFPHKTAKQIVDECDNKTAKGKLLYDVGWYKNEIFYDTEKCRPGEREISLEMIGYGKDWNECNALVKKEGGEMMNFAEYVWFIKCHVEQFGKYPQEGEYKWSWTSSRSSLGRLVNVGYCASDDVYVVDGQPDYSYSRLGVVFFRSVATSGAKAGQAEAESGVLEAAIKRVKEEGYVIFKPV